MPANIPALEVSEDLRAEQYDGTNAAFMAGCINSTSVVGTPTTASCVLNITGFNVTISNGDWIVVHNGQLIEFLTDAAYVVKYRGTARAALGIASVPTLIAGAQAAVSVTLTADMGGTGYTAAPALSGGSNLLAALTILSHTIISATQVDVVVKNNGLLSLGGASVFVIATA